MVAQKKTFKRKHDNLKSNVDIEKITESINDSKNDTSNNANDDTNEEDFDSEDLLAVELDSTHDSTDEEVDEENDIPQSDTEVDPTVFTSDDETNELEFETDSDKSIGETKSEEDTDQTKSEEDTDETKSEEDTDETKSEEDTDETNSEENTGKTSSEEETDETSSEEDIDEEDDNSYNKNNNKISKELSSKGKNSNAVINRKLDTTKHKANDKNGINKFSNEKHNNKAETVKHIESKNKLNNKLQHEQNEKSKLLSKKKLRPKNRNENKNTQNVTINQTFTSDEYEYDSSDEEDIRNTIGNIPMKWYNEYDHIGYDWDGKKIVKPEKGDELDNFLKRMEDPDFWKTVKDIQTGQDVVLSEADIELITRIQKQKIPDVQFDEYAPWVEWFTSQVLVTPLRKIPEHKRSFLPSKPEAKRVSKLVHALKMGWIKSTAEMQKEKQQKNKDPQFYMLWQSDDQAEEMRRIYKHIPAPKRHLPGHAESYNPPPEYLFDKKELKQWNKLETTPWKRKLHFIPQSYKSLREVPAYPRYIKERFQRCLDLYLCPRAFKMRLTIEPETLVPQLPDPKDLQPFPTTMSLVFKGHTDMVRSITVELMGQYIASGGDDMMLKIWEVATGRCLKTINCGGVIRSVAWCPNQAISLIGVAAEKKVLLINPGVGDHLITTKTDELLKIIPQTDIIVSDRVKTAVQWDQATEESYTNGIRVILNHFKIVKQVTWHGKGDYFATVMPDGQNRSVLINQLSKRRSQLPFSRSKGLIQCVLFHPIRPFLFVATQRNIRIYDLVKQEMVKKLLSNSQWISTMAIHPGGDNILVGTYDRKMLWFDLDLSTKPYQTLRLHGTGVRGVAFHKRYPLFASGADDRGLIVSHGMVYNDLLQNPLIVPLKRFSNHESFNDFGILDVIFHPIQPWVFSAGADSTIRMYS